MSVSSPVRTCAAEPDLTTRLVATVDQVSALTTELHNHVTRKAKPLLPGVRNTVVGGTNTRIVAQLRQSYPAGSTRGTAQLPSGALVTRYDDATVTQAMPMTLTARSVRRRAIIAACLAVLLIGAETAGAALGGYVYLEHSRSHLTVSDAALFEIFGTSAVAGVIVVALVLVALTRLARAGSADVIVRVASTAAWLRLLAIVAVLTVITATIGTHAFSGSGPILIVCFTLADAIIVIATARSTRNLAAQLDAAQAAGSPE